jgi:hypothetical protein
MTTRNRESAGALVFWIVSATKSLRAHKVGLSRRWGSAVAAWMSIWAVGCGGSGSTGAPGPDASNDVLPGSETSVALDSSSLDAPEGTTTDSATSDVDPSTTACAVSAEVYCSKFLSCQEAQFGLYFGDVATCKQRVEQFCPDQFVAPGSTVTPAELEACAQAMSDQSCSDFLTSVNPPRVYVGGYRVDGGVVRVRRPVSVGFLQRTRWQFLRHLPGRPVGWPAL